MPFYEYECSECSHEFEEFKTIFHKVNEKRVLTQIAFGIMNISTNPDFFKMMEYTKERGVIPNFTCHGIDMTKEMWSSSG